MSSIGPIINIATDAIVLCIAAYALTKQPKVAFYYFMIIALLVAIAGSAIYLATMNSNPRLAYGASTIAYYISNWVFILGIAYLIRLWVKSVEWQLEERHVRSVRLVTILNYIISTVCTAGLVAITVLNVLSIIQPNVFTPLLIALTWIIVAVLITQCAVMGYLYYKESKGLDLTKKKQLYRLMLFALLQAVSSLLYAIALFVPGVASAGYIVAFLWLALLLWPNALDGFEKDSGSAPAQPRSDIPLSGGQRLGAKPRNPFE